MNSGRSHTQSCAGSLRPLRIGKTRDYHRFLEAGNKADSWTAGKPEIKAVSPTIPSTQEYEMHGIITTVFWHGFRLSLSLILQFKLVAVVRAAPFCGQRHYSLFNQALGGCLTMWQGAMQAVFGI